MDDSTPLDPSLIRIVDSTPQLKGLTTLGKIVLSPSIQRPYSKPTVQLKGPVTTAATLQAHQDAQDILEALIISRNSGGYVATVLGYNAFMPSSHSMVRMALVPVDEDPIIGTTIPVIILEFNAYSKKTVLSHREARSLITQREKQAIEEARITKHKAHTELLELRAAEIAQVAIGDIVEALVYKITPPNYIALRAGSLSIRVGWDELSWGREKQVPGLNEIVRVAITARDEKQLHLQGSIFILTPDPWLSAGERYQPGYPTLAKVVSIVNFGLFVELEPGIEGLLHRNSIPGVLPETKLADHFELQEPIPVVVEQVDFESTSLSVTMHIALGNWPSFRDLLRQFKIVSQTLVETKMLADRLQAQVLNQAHDLQGLSLSRANEQETWLQADYVKNEKLEQLRSDLNTANGKIKTFELQLAEYESTIQQLDTILSKYRKLKLELDSTSQQLDQAQFSYQQSQAAKQQLEEQLQMTKRQLTVGSQNSQQLSQSKPALEVVTWSEQELGTLVARPLLNDDSPAVYITFSNSKQITAGIDWSRENLEGEVYPVPFPHFNHFERRQLLAYKRLCEYPNHFLVSMADRVRNGAGSMLIANKAPAFHKTQTCEFGHSDYLNYTIPEEIKRRGKEAIEAFREWFARKLEQNPRYLEKPHLMEPLMVECMLHFKLSTPPLPVKIANTGLIAISGQTLARLEQQIEELIADAAAYAKADANRTLIINRLGTHAYKGNKPNEPLQHGTPLTDEQVRTILRDYENNFKKIIMALLQKYYRSKFNNQLAFNGSLLILLGFRPCYSCFTRSDLSAFALPSPSATSRPLKPSSTASLSRPITSDDDNDLPF